MSSEKLIYSIDDTCRVFSIAKSTFWKWAASGVFGELIRIGRRTYVSRDAIEKLVEAR
jgi:hypothetical protein